MIKLNFNLRNPNSEKPTPINLVCRWSGKRLVIPTGEVLLPQYWHKEKQRASSTKKFPSHPELNQRLGDFQNDILNLFRALCLENKREPTLNEFKLKVSELTEIPEDESKIGVLNYIRKYIDEATYRTTNKGQPISKSTIQLFEQLFKLIKEYSKKTNKVIHFEDVSLEFYYDLLRFMTIEKNYATNTIGKRIKLLKTILRDADEKRINVNRDYLSRKFKAPIERSDNISLNLEELILIQNLDLVNYPKLMRVRDLFIFQAWTGLRYSDLKNINQSNIQDGYLRIRQEKTGEMVTLPLFQITENILIKYNYDLPRVPSNQKMNNYLKEICQRIPLLNIEVTKKITKGGKRLEMKVKKYEMISTHTARRSFATNLYKMNASTSSIMKLTGHKTEDIFFQYIKESDTESADSVRKIVNEKMRILEG